MVSGFKKKKRTADATLFWKSCPPPSPPSLHPPPPSPPAQMDSRCHWGIKTVFTVTLSCPAPWEQTPPWWESLPPWAWLDSMKNTSLGGKRIFPQMSNFPSASHQQPHQRHVGHYRRSHHPSDGSLFSSHCCVDNWLSTGFCCPLLIHYCCFSCGLFSCWYWRTRAVRETISSSLSWRRGLFASATWCPQSPRGPVSLIFTLNSELMHVQVSKQRVTGFFTAALHLVHELWVCPLWVTSVRQAWHNVGAASQTKVTHTVNMQMCRAN